MFQDALFFDGFAFRHREGTKKSDFSVFFLAQHFHCMFARRVSAVKRAQIGTGTVFPAPLPLVCVQVHEMRSVA